MKTFKFKDSETGKDMVKVESPICDNIEPVQEWQYDLCKIIAAEFLKDLKKYQEREGVPLSLE